MYDNEHFDDVTLNATATLVYIVEVKVEDEYGNIEEEEVEREIDVSTQELELTGSESYDRKMGYEKCYNYSGTIEDEEGDFIEVEMEVWEYPEGAINNVILRRS